MQNEQGETSANSFVYDVSRFEFIIIIIII